MKATTTLLAACLTAASTLVWAGDRGSAEDQLACTPDVYKLCAQHIPDEDAITACLQQNKAQLSAGCKVVFSRPQPATPPKSDDDD